MCQGCDDMAEYYAVMDGVLQERLREMMLVPVSDEDIALLRGKK